MLFNNLPGGVKITPNNEKTILVAKCGCSDMNRSKAMESMAQFRSYLEQLFNPKEADDTLVIIVIPAKEWNIEIYNPKAVDLTEEQIEELELLLEEYKNKTENEEFND